MAARVGTGHPGSRYPAKRDGHDISMKGGEWLSQGDPSLGNQVRPGVQNVAISDAAGDEGHRGAVVSVRFVSSRRDEAEIREYVFPHFPRISSSAARPGANEEVRHVCVPSSPFKNASYSCELQLMFEYCCSTLLLV